MQAFAALRRLILRPEEIDLLVRLDHLKLGLWAEQKQRDEPPSHSAAKLPARKPPIAPRKPRSR